MKKKLFYLIVLCLSILLSNTVLATDEKPWTCTGDEKLVDSCFTVHGRMSVYNGNPCIRIWIIGTNRLLGVLGDDEGEIENDIASKYLGFGSSIYGDFKVCPLTEYKPGQMQMVCVESGDNLVVERFIEGKEEPEVFKL